MVSHSLISNRCIRVVFGPLVYALSLGVFGPLVYALPMGHQFQHLCITQLEMLNVEFALKVWSQLWANKKVKIFCDNQAVVEVLKHWQN